MALTELVNALRQQAIKQREREGELLNDIAYLADLETAEAAADIYAAEKHAYSFDGYLYQLEKLKTVLAAGVPPETALEAVDRRYKREGEPSADFINFVAYGTAAEFAEKYFKKGTKLLVTARCQTRTYTNNEGKKVYVTEFIVEEQEFTESKRAAGNEPAGDDFMQMPEGEELPFN